ncbi:MAG TPA: phenylalanine--tRNA ligase subunit beta [Vicinamibacterales bacterium]|nr:phenylalanine--tRNA ligase subunit beta [Vicinamibacterales bacterium]
MRLVLSWLREFVDIDASAEQIAEKMAIRGFEVAAIDALGGGDAVIDFEITANRPDCLSVVGLAREIATAFELPMIPAPKADALPSGRSDRLRIHQDDQVLCPRFASVLADVTIGASPAWMTTRLQAAGVRPISTIVDVTNYVNIEIGQPMHAYDFAKLAGGELRARRAKPGETIRTLDNVERKLDPDMLVIADRDRAQGIAGVMGGAASEVSAATTTVAFEAAYFKPASVRRTSKKIGLKTEASARFERGADISIQVFAIERAVTLMRQINAGQVVGPVIDCYPDPAAERRIVLRRERLARLLGAVVPDADVVRILRALGLTVTPVDGGWDTIVPLFRVDVFREADLIEEVGRHYGFDRLETTFPVVTVPAPPPDPRIPRDHLVRRVLTAAGASEAVTFGFIEAKAVLEGRQAPIAVANPLSAKFDTLRPSLLPGLIDAVAHNRRHGRRDVRLFEIGTRFALDGESRGVGLAWTGNGGTDHWSGGARDVDFFDAKGAVEAVCAALDVRVRCEATAVRFLVDGQSASVVIADGAQRGTPVGLIGLLAPAIADARGLPRQDRVMLAELDLDRLAGARGATSDAVRPLPRYPFVVRDLSIVVADTLPAEIIRETIQAAAGDGPAPLVDVGFFDRYQGTGVPQGRVSVSVRLTFQSADRTLTDADVQQSFDTILKALQHTHNAVQR